jgi:hypothetical protein
MLNFNLKQVIVVSYIHVAHMYHEQKLKYKQVLLLYKPLFLKNLLV